MRTAVVILMLLSSVRAWAQSPAARDRPVIVASKPFGESYLLAEVFAQLLESHGIRVERRPGLGATEIAFGALRSNAIDVYPEYTGTGLLAILHESPDSTMRTDPRRAYQRVARRFMTEYGVQWLPPLGFQNGYAIAVRRETATKLNLRSLSDLGRASADLVAGFTSDFIGRPDGLAGLSGAYGMRFKSVRPLSPAVKYVALAESAVDVIDGYSTDGLLARYDLVTLVDDSAFFPPYEAAALISPRLASERTDAVAALTRLSGRLDEASMRTWNRRIEVDGEPIARVATDVLKSLGMSGAEAPAGVTGAPATRPRFFPYFWGRRAETVALAVRHLQLVLLALLAAVAVAVPLGLVLERTRRGAEWVVGGLGVLQTIPSIALLAFMIPLLGVGFLPALVALWLYALYPIARNTYTGVRSADSEAVEACEAMGATAVQRLLWVRLPLAAPVVVAGVRTAAVITVGAATLAAFIGAGGLGEPIVTGLALADSRLILSGALPAALLALLVDGVLAAVERAVRPAHLRARKQATSEGRRDGMRFILLSFAIAHFAAACGTPTAPEYAVEISLTDSVVARRGPGEVNLVIPVKLRNLDARPLYYEECGHALQRRVGSSWQLVPVSLCRGTTPYSIELDTGASYQFTFRVTLSLPSDEWPAVGAAGEYRVVLWLTAAFRNSYGIPPQPLALSSRTSPVFSIKEDVIDF